MSFWETLSAVVRTLLIMSITGSIATLLMLALKPLIKNRLPKRAQYYLWLIVLVAFIVPFSALVTLPFNTPLSPVQNLIETKIKSNSEWQEQVAMELYGVPYDRLDNSEKVNVSYRELKARNISNYDFVLSYVLILGIAYFLKEIVSYLVYVYKLRRGRLPARKNELDLLPDKSPRLYRNPLAATPMLLGVFRPVIYIPDREYSNQQLQNILLHELAHFRRCDVLIKWIAAIAVYAHWFNPLAYLMRREIDRACELACDEAVINRLDNEGKQSYGDTLIEMACDTKCHRIIISTTLCEEKKTLKERLGAIMKSKKPTRSATIFSCVLLAIVLCVIIVVGAPGKLNSQTIQPSISEIELDNLDLEASSGVGVVLDFESDNFIIFHGDFGLFGYDLSARELVFSVDFIKAVGIAGSVQGSAGTAVEVSNDGKTIIISEYNAETESRGEVCYIDVPTLTYTRKEYKPLENAFQRHNANGYIFPGVNISGVKYLLDDTECSPFNK